jgi:putative acetyltransferase
VQIRPERADEIAAIHELVAAAFPGDGEARLVGALRSAGRLTASLVADVDGRPVGHAALSPVTVAGDVGSGLGLAPVAVHPDFQRRGLGGALVDAALAEAARRGAGFVVVLGDPRFYGRHGFEAAARWGLSDEYGGGAAFQAIELTEGAIPATGGLVRYAPEFGLLE